jgi:hypothetical protein
MWEEMSRSRCLATALGLCIAAAIIPVLGAEHPFDGVYSGKRVLIKGSDPHCPAEDGVSVTIHGEMLSFSDSALKKFPIGFYPSQDGSFGEISFGEGGDDVQIRGRIIGDVIEVDVTNRRCEHHWHLKKE